MVCLAASIVTKGGRALVSRQYHDMTRARIEGLLSAFPKLVGSGNRQHTYVETDNIRYVYQPIENMYLVILTNRQSNILEDLETLRLLARLVPEYVPTVDEAGVIAGAFELIFAFDEVISMGHKENITLAQVRENTEMESHEERLHKMIMQTKLDDAKAHMRKKALEIEKAKFERRALGALGAGTPSGLEVDPDTGRVTKLPANSLMAASDSKAPAMGIAQQVAAAQQARAARSGAGLQLGGKPAPRGAGFRGGANVLEQLRSEGEKVDSAPAKVTGLSAVQQEALMGARQSSEPVSVLIEERLTATVSREGGADAVEVQGQVSLTVRDEAAATLSLRLQDEGRAGFQFKTHPNVDKQAYASSGAIQLRDPARPFPLNTALAVLKWRVAGADEGMLPITVTCWPNPGAEETAMTLEYECPDWASLMDVVIRVPLPHSDRAPSVVSCDGESRWVSKENALLWEVPYVDESNQSGAIEFAVPGQVDTDSFFPITVSFASKKTVYRLQVADVVNVMDQTPIKHSVTSALTAERYIIQ